MSPPEHPDPEEPTETVVGAWQEQSFATVPIAKKALGGLVADGPLHTSVGQIAATLGHALAEFELGLMKTHPWSVAPRTDAQHSTCADGIG